MSAACLGLLTFLEEAPDPSSCSTSRVDLESRIPPMAQGGRAGLDTAHTRHRQLEPLVDGGRAGIRTRERVAPLAIFKTAAFVRSATLPRRVYLRELSGRAVEGTPSCRQVAASYFPHHL
jgi:hypothetical protein